MTAGKSWVNTQQTALVNQKPSSRELSGPKLPLPSQPVAAGYQRVRFMDIGTVDVPDSMQVQEPESPQRIVIKQKEMDTYARVAIAVYHNDKGEVPRLIDQLTKADVQQFETGTRREIEAGLSTIHPYNIDWYPAISEYVNGMNSVKINYRYSFTGFKTYPMLVTMHYFFNHDEVIVLTMSYREDHASIWEKPFKEILNSFRITKIK